MKRAKLEKLIADATDLPTLPTIATQVLAVVRNSESSTRDLCKIVELDPIMAAAIMRMANSAYFGLPRVVTDLHRAIGVIGFAAVRNLALSECVKSMYRNAYRCGTFQAEGVWVHSVAVAVMAETIARRLWPGQADEAFLAGIVHDVGMIAEWNLLPDRFDMVVRAFEGTSRPFREAEQAALGFDHCLAGSVLLRLWKLPKHFVQMARYHHEQSTSSAEPNGSGERLAVLVHLAETLCAVRGNGFFDAPRNDELTASLLKTLGWADLNIPDFLSEVDARLRDARVILAL